MKLREAVKRLIDTHGSDWLVDSGADNWTVDNLLEASGGDDDREWCVQAGGLYPIDDNGQIDHLRGYRPCANLDPVDAVRRGVPITDNSVEQYDWTECYPIRESRTAEIEGVYCASTGNAYVYGRTRAENQTAEIVDDVFAKNVRPA